MSNRRAVRRALAAAGFALVVGVLVTGWVVWSGQVAADVAVRWSAQSPTCEDATVDRSRPRRPVINATESMRCVITVEVINRSGRTVHVDHAVAPYVGPQTGTVVTAENAPPSAEYGIHALLPIDRDLPAGESTAFDLVLVFYPEGCNARGAFWVSEWPTVTVDALGRSQDLHGNKAFSFSHDQSSPGCTAS